MSRSIWLVAMLPAALFASAGGCGDDEGLPLPAMTGAGAGGDSTDGMTDPEAGGPRANFGRSCSRQEDCGEDLTCLTDDSLSLTKGGPPRGLCTASCTGDPGSCEDYADDARCVNFGRFSYCMEACEYGSVVDDAFDKDKCHGRTEFACKPLLEDTAVSCETTEDCSEGEVCKGTCQRDTPTCMPQCNGDFDCGSGRFCDPRTGECVRDLPRGRRLAERCNVAADPDPCRGSCGLIERAEGGRCDETCTLGSYPTCGVAMDPASVGCAIPVAQQATYGDMGFCAPLCDCTDDCPVGLECVVATLPYLQRPGFCATPAEGDAVRSSCTGAAGAGGTPGSVGSGGALGTGGGAGQGGEPAEGGAAGAFEFTAL